MFNRVLLLKHLSSLLRPVAALCVRYGIRVQDIIEALKSALVHEATRQLNKEGEKVTVSRVGVMTGLQRKEVLRLQSGQERSPSQHDLVAKVLGQWQFDKEFVATGGKPRILPLDGSSRSFYGLVKKVSQDLNPATVLFELERCGLVRRTRSGVLLISPTYALSERAEDGFDILSDDLRSLLGVVEHNLSEPVGLSHLHARTMYDKIRPEGIERIKEWLLREGHAMHDRARAFLSQYDQDVNPDPNFKGQPAKVFLGTFGGVENEVIAAPERDEQEE
ncbi:MAG: hypothetical protein K1X79_09225 [Oligoflexia bacterium]|nr:hypothetical protein [Oligoflexia bacterium]